MLKSLTGNAHGEVIAWDFRKFKGYDPKKAWISQLPKEIQDLFLFPGVIFVGSDIQGDLKKVELRQKIKDEIIWLDTQRCMISLAKEGHLKYPEAPLEQKRVGLGWIAYELYGELESDFKCHSKELFLKRYGGVPKNYDPDSRNPRKFYKWQPMTPQHTRYIYLDALIPAILVLTGFRKKYANNKNKFKNLGPWEAFRLAYKDDIRVKYEHEDKKVKIPSRPIRGENDPFALTLNDDQRFSSESDSDDSSSDSSEYSSSDSSKKSVSSASTSSLSVNMDEFLEDLIKKSNEKREQEEKIPDSEKNTSDLEKGEVINTEVFEVGEENEALYEDISSEEEYEDEQPVKKMRISEKEERKVKRVPISYPMSPQPSTSKQVLNNNMRMDLKRSRVRVEIKAPVKPPRKLKVRSIFGSFMAKACTGLAPAIPKYRINPHLRKCLLCANPNHNKSECPLLLKRKYLFCPYCRGTDHCVRMCRDLHHICTKCHVRGHEKTSMNCRLSLRTLREKFEKYADLGDQTRKRKREPEWGFYSFSWWFSCFHESPISYETLMELQPEDAIDLIDNYKIGAKYKELYGEEYPDQDLIDEMKERMAMKREEYDNFWGEEDYVQE